MKKKWGITSKIFLGLILGIILGLILYSFRDNKLVSDFLVGTLFYTVGKIFINLIKMLVVPFVFVSLTVGSASVGDIKKLGRIGTKTLGFYLVTTAIAVSLALGISLIVNPGIGFNLPSEASFTATEAPKLAEIIIGIIPTNPFGALANGKMLQIIFTAILLGIGITIINEKGKVVRDGFESLNEVMLKLLTIIMELAPYGVFALVTKTFATLGYSAMKPIAIYMLCVIAGLIIHALVTYQIMLIGFTKLSPIKFLKNIAPIIMVAFSTASSSATLPLTMETSREKLGVSNSVASFTLPLGATINMDGTAIMQGVATVFLAQAYGIELSATALLTVILTATLASIGTAGIPGSGLIMLSMVLTQAGIPVEGIAIIMGIDRLLDMCRTAINIVGDTVCTVIIAKQEGEFNQEIFYEKSKKTA